MITNEYLKFNNVYKSYGKKSVLDNIDLSVTSGELSTLVGPSGCGKSTLLRLITGESMPTSGTVTLDNETIGSPAPDRGIIFQRYSLFPHMTVLENVALGLQFTAANKSEIKDKAQHYLERVRLGEHGGKYPHQLSGGMQQRVAIAQSLIMKPKILMMDEPFGALDPDTREDMQLFLLELWEQEKMTIFFITHDLEEAVFVGSRILVLSQYYTDDRKLNKDSNRGSKIVSDYSVTGGAHATGVKRTAEFGELIAQIREEGFNPEYLQHAKDFNLTHPDSFQTLTREEHFT